MQNIIIKKEWIEILEQQSNELRDAVMAAIYDFALRNREPENLTPVAQVSYLFIKTEMLSLDASLDFDGAREAALRKKRAQERRAARAAEKATEQKKENSEAKIITIEKNRFHKCRPLPASGNVPAADRNDFDYFYAFEEFYNLYPGQKDDLQLEYSRLRFQYAGLNQEIERFPDAIRFQMQWHQQMKARGYRVPSFPSMTRWLTDQCWRDKFPVV